LGKTPSFFYLWTGERRRAAAGVPGAVRVAVRRVLEPKRLPEVPWATAIAFH